MRNVLIENRLKAINLLRCTEIFISTYNCCIKLTSSSVTEEVELKSNQEEADTKLTLHCIHALSLFPNKIVLIRSPSADIDILVILLSKIKVTNKVYLDFGVGLYRKVVCLGDIEMDENKKKSLIGFHAFTGNDYVSSFFLQRESYLLENC